MKKGSVKKIKKGKNPIKIAKSKIIIKEIIYMNN